MKIKSLILLFLATVFIVGCNSYNRVLITGSDFYGRNKVIKNIDRYDVYVHHKDSIYEMDAPAQLDSAHIASAIVSLETEDYEDVVGDTVERVLADERNDIHIYLEDDVAISPNNPEVILELEEDQISEVRLAAKENNGVFGVIGTVLLVLLAVIVGLFIFLIFSIANASNNSGSDSGSGDSGSGDSGSGCYIATMAYGSYDAPKVLILRKFRDQFLQKHNAGRAFISWYYKNSPSFVEKHRSKKWLHATLRKGLDVFVFVLKPFFKG